MSKEEQQVTVQDWLEELSVHYCKYRAKKGRPPFGSSAALRLDGYIISLRTKYYVSSTEATDGINKRIQKAVLRFNLTEGMPVQLKDKSELPELVAKDS
ncbi:MAG: hypothetical protein ACWA44_02330 [Thiotrichales bacterium]